MIPMALVALAGTGTIVLATFFIQHCAAVHRRVASATLEEQVQEKLKRAKVLDSRLAQELLGGADMDASIDDFMKDRSSIHALPTEKSWLWDSDHLAKWTKAQLTIIVAAINHKARLITLSVLVGVVLLVVAIDAILYSNLSASTPLLSPSPPPKSTTVPAAVPVPGSFPGTVDPGQSTIPPAP